MIYEFINQLQTAGRCRSVDVEITPVLRSGAAKVADPTLALDDHQSVFAHHHQSHVRKPSGKRTRRKFGVQFLFFF